MKKKILSCLLAMMAATLTACGQTPAAAPAAAETPDGAAQTDTTEEATQEPAADTAASEDNKYTEDAADVATEAATEAATEEESAPEEALTELSDLQKKGYEELTSYMTNDDATYEQVVPTTEGKIYADGFILTVPRDVIEQAVITKYTYDDLVSYNFHEAENAANGNGGFMYSIDMEDQVPQSLRYMPGDFIGVLKNTEDDTTRYLYSSYPSDVPFDPEHPGNYHTLSRTANVVQRSLVAADGYEFTSMTYPEVMADVESTTSGVIIDAAMHSFTIQTNEGDIVNFSGELDAAHEGLQLGHCYEVTYTGLFGYGNEPSNARFVSMKNIDDQAPAKNYDAMMTASGLIIGVQLKDMPYIASYCEFPLVIDGKEYSEDAFSSAKFEDIFNDDLVRIITYDDLYYKEMKDDDTSVRIYLGYDNPGVTIEKVGDKDAPSSWRVTRIDTQYDER